MTDRCKIVICPFTYDNEKFLAINSRQNSRTKCQFYSRVHQPNWKWCYLVLCTLCSNDDDYGSNGNVNNVDNNGNNDDTCKNDSNDNDYHYC